MPQDPEQLLVAVGLGADEVNLWLASEPFARRPVAGVLADDAQKLAEFCLGGDALLARLADKPARGVEQIAAADLLKAKCRAAREAFLRRHGEAVYDALTANRTKPVRVEPLIEAAASQFPGLVPGPDALAAEAARQQRDKEGIEYDQGILFAHWLGAPAVGTHLMETMLRPKPESFEALAAYRRDGRLELDHATLERHGAAIHLFLRNPAYLNAEDNTTLDDVETAVDVAILDPDTDVAVLRGGVTDHARYAGRQVFCTGINLTHIYEGRIPYMWYMRRDLGFVHKMFRGLVLDGQRLGDNEDLREKPWLAAVQAFAIGGGCQYLLVMDHVIVEQSAYFTLPARREGLIPGVANLRLPRFVGDRIARQAILFDRRIDADSPEGRMIADTLVPDGDIDAGIERTVAVLTDSGMTSSIANRRAFRVTQEPLAAFRDYMAVYAREQAVCHQSEALVRNIEEGWIKPRSKN